MTRQPTSERWCAKDSSRMQEIVRMLRDTKMPKNEYVLAKSGVDTSDNEPYAEVWGNGITSTF